jgi:DNA-binding NarL/FixJ family response regulator
MTERTAFDSVAIVDQDAAFRSLAASPLERCGFAVREFATGEEALESLRREGASLVLLEVRLPGICGYELCRELRDEFGNDLSIIFVSDDRTEPRDRIAGLLVGADDYLAKPVAPDELVARVRVLTRRRPPHENPRQRRLTTRELEVLRLLAGGLRQDQIAAELVISSKTVAGHIERILEKLNVHSRTEAVALAYRERLVG